MSKAITHKQVDISSINDLSQFASTLKKFIVANNLYTEIQGKNYVNVEGWEFAGASTGVLPRVAKVVQVPSESGEIKYRAEVELVRLSDGLVVGSGIAVCSNNESKRRGADEYVIASMAQTRAIGKAYRNMFGFLMKLAGYEPTPAEDMDGELGGSSQPASNPEFLAKIEKIKSAIDLKLLLESADTDDLLAHKNEIEKKRQAISATA